VRIPAYLTAIPGTLDRDSCVTWPRFRPARTGRGSASLPGLRCGFSPGWTRAGHRPAVCERKRALVTLQCGIGRGGEFLIKHGAEGARALW